MKVVGSYPVTGAEALDILKKRKKEGEMGYEQEIAMELLKKTVKLSKSDAMKLKGELESLGFLKPEHVVKIVDTLPATEMEFRAVFEKAKLKIKQDEIQKVLEAVSRYV